MPLPRDYAERVYAGVLGKIIGVYLGRPFEQWTHRQIEDRLGEIRDYVTGHPALEPSRRANPLVVSDDDISGTFTVLRALADSGCRRDLTPAQIGQTWLNYVVEERSTHWWGGVGVSVEHTVFLRLKDGMRAPETGSAAHSGKVLSEQIGAQIFIDGWAMACPGDPELAAELARRAASVSHDGEAIHAARVVAAMEAQAFVEDDVDTLVDRAVSLIPRDSTIFRAIDDIRGWHAGEPAWRHTRARIEERYGYDRYRGICHVVPNHALIVMALLYGDGDFARSLTIVNTSGWDTDCNSGNLGCLLGIRNGVAGIGDERRAPVADRMYLSSADGGRAITDAATEAVHVVNAGRTARRDADAPGGGRRDVAPGMGQRRRPLRSALARAVPADPEPRPRPADPGHARVEGLRGARRSRPRDGRRRRHRRARAGDAPVSRAAAVRRRHDPPRARARRHTTLAEAPFRRRQYAEPHALAVRVIGPFVRAIVDDEIVLEARDGELTGGAVALVCEEGCLTCDAVRVGPPC
jgi:ADP-ribosylglycohydrolase